MHSWFKTDGAVIFSSEWSRGWRAERRGDRFAVYCHAGERLRIGSDGSMSFGDPEPYWFQSAEWAQLCADRLNSLDTAFGRGPYGMSLSTSGDITIGTASPGFSFEVRNGRGWEAEQLLAIDQQGVVKRFNLPALAMIWWRSTTLYRVWRKLMWGERA